jgi:hypothetical protein
MTARYTPSTCPTGKIGYASADEARAVVRRPVVGNLRPYRCKLCAFESGAAVYHVSSLSPTRYRDLLRARAAKRAAEDREASA